MKVFRGQAQEWAKKMKKSRNQAKVFDSSALLVMNIFLSLLKRIVNFIYIVQESSNYADVMQ